MPRWEDGRALPPLLRAALEELTRGGAAVARMTTFWSLLSLSPRTNTKHPSTRARILPRDGGYLHIVFPTMLLPTATFLLLVLGSSTTVGQILLL
jgi:hypothetical protein